MCNQSSNYEKASSLKTTDPIKYLQEQLNFESVDKGGSCNEIQDEIAELSANINRFENSLILLYEILKNQDSAGLNHRTKLTQLLDGKQKFFIPNKKYSVKSNKMLSYDFVLLEIEGYRETLESIKNKLAPEALDSCLADNSLKSKYLKIEKHYKETLASELRLFYSLADMVFNKNSGTIILPSNAMDFNYGYTEVEITIAPRKDQLNSINQLLNNKNLPQLDDAAFDPVSVKLPVFKKGGFKLTSSVGFIFNSVQKNKNYGISVDSLLISDKNGLSPMIGVQINAQTALSKGLQAGITFGSALPLKDEDIIGASFFIGPSFTFGNLDNLILSTGISLSRVKELKNGYKIGNMIKKEFNLDNNLRNKYETGFYFGLSYTIFKRKVVSETSEK